MMVNDTLWVTCGSGRVIKGDRVPLVFRQLPVKFRIASGDKIFVLHLTEPLAARPGCIVDINDYWLRLAKRKGFFHHR